MTLRKKTAFNFLVLIPDSVTHLPCCSLDFTRWQFVKRKMGKKKGTYAWKQWLRSTGMSWAVGQLGDISASGQSVLALTQWVTGGNKAYPYSPEQFKDSPPCLSFLSLIQLFSNFRVNQNHLEAC